MQTRPTRLEEEKILEAVLFAAGDAVPIAALALSLGYDIPATRSMLQRMSETYTEEEAGIQLMEIDDMYQLCTNPKYHEYAQHLLPEPSRRSLTQPLLETLSIIAYKQPVTKSVIEGIRGVSAEHAVNKLMEYGLVSEKGRLDAPGKPILLGTSPDFLRYFGLKTVNDFLNAHPQQDNNPVEQLALDEEYSESNEN